MNGKTFAAFFPLALSLCSCDQEPVAIEIFPAVLQSPQIEAPAEWRPVQFAGSVRSPAGTYLVSPDRLFSDWNIAAFKPSPQADGSVAINVRLNEYARRKMAEFSSQADNLKKPLAVNVNGRWADFTPLLGPVGNRMTLYGLTASEAETLQHQIDVR